MNQGSTIVLSADRSLMSDYRLLFDGMLAASQTTTTPRPVMRATMMHKPPVHEDGRAVIAPMGLRRVEAALHRQLGPGRLAVADPDTLDRFVGPGTRLVALSAGDPLGMGMNSTTMTGIAGGRIVPTDSFARLLKRLHRLLDKRSPKARVLLGGPGAWQLALHREEMDRLGIDHVVTGYCEANIATVVDDLLNGRPVGRIVEGQCPAARDIPPVLGATTMGVVEISRGCGWGCSFCTLRDVPMMHLPPETVLSDLRTNVEAGRPDTAVLSEDVFRYGGTGRQVEPDRLIDLLEQARRIEGIRLIQTDHANVASVAGWSDEQLARARSLLVGDTGARYLWVNVGIETASGALLRRVGGVGKMAGVSDDEWPGFCTTQLDRLSAAGFFPFVSLVVGLPGETREDVRRTLTWVESVKMRRWAIFPVTYAPVAPDEDTPELTRLHWKLIRTCYRMNYHWTPRMVWDNQRATGVGLPWRLMMQGLGIGQSMRWKLLLALKHWKAPE